MTTEGSAIVGVLVGAVGRILPDVAPVVARWGAAPSGAYVHASAGPWLVATIIMAVGLGVGLCTLAILPIVRTLSARTKVTTGDELARRLPLPLSICVGAFAAASTLRRLGDVFTDRQADTVMRVLWVVFILGAAWAVI